MMNRLESLNNRLKSYELTATGGFAFYIIMCTVLTTVIGMYSLLTLMARWLYPMVS